MELRQAASMLGRIALSRPSVLALASPRPMALSTISTSPIPPAALSSRPFSTTHAYQTPPAAAEAVQEYPSPEPSPSNPSAPFRRTLLNSPSDFIPKRRPNFLNNFKHTGNSAAGPSIGAIMDEVGKNQKSWRQSGSTPMHMGDFVKDTIEQEELKSLYKAGFTEEDFFARKKAKLSQPRLKPSTGRIVMVGANGDCAAAFRILNRNVSQNKVPRDFNRQRFHERPGLKRKRLKSERWRRVFMQGFKAACARVDELRKMGW